MVFEWIYDLRLLDLSRRGMGIRGANIDWTGVFSVHWTSSKIQVFNSNPISPGTRTYSSTFASRHCYVSGGSKFHDTLACWCLYFAIPSRSRGGNEPPRVDSLCAVHPHLIGNLHHRLGLLDSGRKSRGCKRRRGRNSFPRQAIVGLALPPSIPNFRSRMKPTDFEPLRSLVVIQVFPLSCHSIQTTRNIVVKSFGNKRNAGKR